MSGARPSVKTLTWFPVASKRIFASRFVHGSVEKRGQFKLRVRQEPMIQRITFSAKRGLGAKLLHRKTALTRFRELFTLAAVDAEKVWLK
jgi:hypothetical protein